MDETLRAVAATVADEWDLTLGHPFGLSRHSFVAPAGPDCVLKVVSRHDNESLHEAAALRLWAGRGAVTVLKHAPARRALLLARAKPGTDLSGLEPTRATEIAADLAPKLWRTAAAPFRWIGDEVPRWLAQAQPRSWRANELLRRARPRYENLRIGSGRLIHGDFHHHNILAAETGYVAIDPKPMLGEPEFDVAPFLWNPLGSVMTLEETERRLAAFTAIGLDEGKLRAWALIRGAYLCIGDWLGNSAADVLLSIDSR